jgi:hypothetical protein
MSCFWMCKPMWVCETLEERENFFLSCKTQHSFADLSIHGAASEGRETFFLIPTKILWCFRDN